MINLKLSIELFLFQEVEDELKAGREAELEKQEAAKNPKKPDKPKEERKVDHIYGRRKKK